jgi:hypothetical protein
MRDFELPLLSAETPIKEAFGPMISRGVSGVVIKTGRKYRLLHFAQLRGAFEHQLQTVGDVIGFVDLESGIGGSRIVEMEASGAGGIASQEIVFKSGSEYCLLGADINSNVAVICSRHEPGALMYLASTPGYACDANPTHYYPPHIRGSSNKCVSLGCPGHLP